MKSKKGKNRYASVDDDDLKNRIEVGGGLYEPRTTVLIALNCGSASLKARISVGQTKVKSLV